MNVYSTKVIKLFLQNNRAIIILLMGLGIVAELLILAGDISLIKSPLVFTSSCDTLKIQFTGVENQWQFLYPGKDGIFNTSDDVKVDKSDNLIFPEKNEIVIEMESKDYIYCLDIPELEISQIAVPNMEFNLQFLADDQMTFSMLPGAICGRSNEKLERKIIIVSKDEYSLWLDEKKNVK